MSAGMKSSHNTPLEGLAFLISAITAGCPAAILARRAPTKSRVSTRDSASARTMASGFLFCAAATSSRLTATIWFRMSVMLGRLLRAVLQNMDKNAVHHQTHHDKKSGDAQR